MLQELVSHPAIGRDDENALIQLITLPLPDQDVVTDMAILAHAGAADLFDGVQSLGVHFDCSPEMMCFPGLPVTALPIGRGRSAGLSEVRSVVGRQKTPAVAQGHRRAPPPDCSRRC